MAGQEDVKRDAVVIGGGAAGLSAALMLTRSRRSVTVVDAGAPRNAPADGVHGLLGLEGISPAELVERGRAEVRGYGGEILTGEVVDVSSGEDEFTVTLADGQVLRARRLLVATGLVDELPEVPGVREQWGRGVVHCPYCHGWEVRDQRIGVLAGGPMSVHQTLLFRQLSNQVTFFQGASELADEDRARLLALGVQIVGGPVECLQVDGQTLTGVVADGAVVPIDAVVVSTRMVARVGFLAGLGLLPSPHPVGEFIQADATGRTAVPGVWVAGNATNLSAQVGAAAAEGAMAAAHINADLVMADANRAVVEAG